MAAAVVAAMIGIGAGTWFLGSGEDPAPASSEETSFSSGASAPEVPAAEQGPVLSVAPAPSDADYAAARRASRAGAKDPVLKDALRTVGAKKKTKPADPPSTDPSASG